MGGEDEFAESCQSCRFWTCRRVGPLRDGDGSDDVDVCRRYPPTRNDVPEDMPALDKFGFPFTHSSNWCGEYRPRTPLPVVPTTAPPKDYLPPVPPGEVSISPVPYDQTEAVHEWRDRWQEWDRMTEGAARDRVASLNWPPRPKGVEDLRRWLVDRLDALADDWRPRGIVRNRLMPPTDFAPYRARIMAADAVAILRAKLANTTPTSKKAAYLREVLAANPSPPQGRG